MSIARTTSMSLDLALRRPVSTRHAFALATDLAFRRDPLHSVIVPFLLRAPWLLALVVFGSNGAREGLAAVLFGVALVGLSVSGWTVDGALRWRARSVFNTPHGAPPAPVLECYEVGLRRLPWLYLTECVRGFVLSIGFGAFFLPGVYLAYRLAFATEAVVLSDRNTFGAFQHSLHLSRGRLERWLEMVVASVVVVLAVLFAGTALAVVVHGLSWDTWKIVVPMMLVVLWPVFQYAWTFFYMRLIEVEEPQAEDAGPFLASGSPGGAWGTPGGVPPRLTLVNTPRQDVPGEGREGGGTA